MFSEHKNNTASWENEHTQKNYIFWEEPTVTHRAPCHWVHFSKWHEKYDSTESSKLFFRIFSANDQLIVPVSNLAGKWAKILCVYIVFWFISKNLLWDWGRWYFKINFTLIMQYRKPKETQTLCWTLLTLVYTEPPPLLE